MNTETYQFICTECRKPYRGILYNCPHCGAQLRDKPDYDWKLIQKLITAVDKR